jgi:hypothetical protein
MIIRDQKRTMLEMFRKIATNLAAVYAAGIISFGALVYFWTAWGDQGMLYDTCPGVSAPPISFIQIGFAVLSFGVFVASAVAIMRLAKSQRQK